MRGEKPLRILMLSPQFPPLADSEAFCAGKMVLALREAGADVTVFCDPDTFRRHGVVDDASPLWEKLRDVTVPLHVPERDNPLALACLGIEYRCWRTYPRWIHSAVTRARELHREKPFDIVYSRSLPMASHIAGYWCSQVLGLPWIANDDDPWDVHIPPGTVEKIPWMADKVSRHWLKKTMRSADAVTFPSRRLGEVTLRTGGGEREFEVIPHVGFAASAEPALKGFVLLHAGTLGSTFGLTRRPTESLLAGVALFLAHHPEARGSFFVKLVGVINPTAEEAIRESGLSGTVENLGRVRYEESLRQIAAASACLLIEPDASEGILLLSKLADYIAARKPVLSISPAVGTTADLMPEPGLMLCRARDVEGIARAIEGLYDDHRAGRLDARRPSEKLVREFSSGAVAGKFLSVCERIIKHT